MSRCKPHRLSAAEKLETLNLYVRIGDSEIVAERLGISGTAVRDRLRRMGIRLKDMSYNEYTVTDLNGNRKISQLRLKLAVEIARETATPSAAVHTLVLA